MTIPIICGACHCLEVEVSPETIVSPNAYYKQQEAGHQSGQIIRTGNSDLFLWLLMSPFDVHGAYFYGFNQSSKPPVLEILVDNVDGP